MSTTQLFVIIGILLITAEAIVPGFFILPIGVGFLIASIGTLLIEPTALQLTVLGISILISYVFFWKWVKPRTKKHGLQTNVDSLIGKVGVVNEDINPEKNTGYVKVYGDQWRALSNEMIVKGTEVRITRVDGNKVHVVRV